MRSAITLVLFIFLTNSLFSQVYGTEIHSWDFENGIPDTWINQSESEIGIWEYRGPSTEPDNTVCSQGSCGALSVPITSESLDNGFVIFDSNYWDDDQGPCGSLGTGQDPGPHHAWLITDPVDLTSQPTVVLTFQQQYKHFTTETSVHCSIDGGETFELLHLNDTAPSSFSETSEWVSVNISDLAGGQSDVRFKFDFDGQYYFWALDDIVLFEPSQNDVLLENPKYTTFTGLLEPNGLGDMEYDQYPYIFDVEFNYSSKITNIGGLPQNDVSMNIRLKNELNEIVFSENTQSNLLEPGQVNSASFGSSFLAPEEIGKYEIRFLAEQAEIDETPLNNEITEDFSISEYAYARDENELEDTFIPNPIYNDDTIMVGNCFVLPQLGDLFESVTICVSDSSDVGAEIYAVVMDFNRDTIYGVTEPYQLNEYNLNQQGENKYIHLDLIDPIITEDTLYQVFMVHDMDSELNAFVGRSGVIPPFTSFVAFPESNGLAYMVKAPMVKMNIFPAGTIPGCMDETAANYLASADTEDGSCLYPGCTNEEASNYSPDFNFEDGSCSFQGCTDPEADNYDPEATEDDGSCQFLGCTDVNANNFDPEANTNDGSCTYNDAFFAVSDTSGCIPFTVTISNQTEVVEGGICEFEILGVANNDECFDQWEYTFTEPGEYTISYSYTVGEFTSSYELTNIVAHANPDAPTLTFDDDSNVLICSGCENATTINWYSDDGLLLSGTNATIDIIDNGNYSVEIFDENGCTAISEELLVIVIGVEEIAGVGINIFPNPFNETLTISAIGPILEIELYDIHGKLLRNLNSTQPMVEMNLADLPSGLYLFRVTTINGTHTSSVMKR